MQYASAQSDSPENYFSTPRPSPKVTQAQVDMMNFDQAKEALIKDVLNVSYEYERQFMSSISKPITTSPINHQKFEERVRRNFNRTKSKDNFSVEKIMLDLYRNLDKRFNDYKLKMELNETIIQTQSQKFALKTNDTRLADLEKKVQQSLDRINVLEKSIGSKVEKIDFALSNSKKSEPERKFLNFERFKSFDFLFLLAVQVLLLIYIVFKQE